MHFTLSKWLKDGLCFSPVAQQNVIIFEDAFCEGAEPRLTAIASDILSYREEDESYIK